MARKPDAKGHIRLSFEGLKGMKAYITPYGSYGENHLVVSFTLIGNKPEVP